MNNERVTTSKPIKTNFASCCKGSVHFALGQNIHGKECHKLATSILRVTLMLFIILNIGT